MIRVFFRLRLPHLAGWCVEPVVRLVLDHSSTVSSLAIDLLEVINGE
ncbi:unnamed protein product [Protopolystoma xenopodis]|uniref:Uncharacterized protein n=1 Tax=Protopolystoma xenopodis TaxID=117903 RepID=A0A448WNM4_9PLAT|nr:unnamed protein product [Protopolystoma xenopodis]